MKLGVIFCGFNTAQYISNSLQPWVQAREKQIGGNQIVISAVSVPFIRFPASRTDDSGEIIRDYFLNGFIDQITVHDNPLEEVVARGNALNYLKSVNCDAVIQVDSDEFYTLEQIEKILQIVNANPYIVWFRLSLKNYIFDGKTYLEEPFQPPRIHRIKTIDGFEAAGFWDDNSVFYTNGKNTYQDRSFPTKTIHKNIVWVKHLTWLNDERGRDKVNYQKSRWGNDLCSYEWDDERKELKFNEAYYKRMGIPLPQIVKES